MIKRLSEKRKNALTKYKQQLINRQPDRLQPQLVIKSIYNVMLIDELKRRLEILS